MALVVEVNGQLIFGPPKTHQHRTVVVPIFLREELARQIFSKAPEDLLFASHTGTPLRVSNVRRRWFDRAAAAAGIPGLTPHELRHTTASLAIASGPT